MKDSPDKKHRAKAKRPNGGHSEAERTEIFRKYHHLLKVARLKDLAASALLLGLVALTVGLVSSGRLTASSLIMLDDVFKSAIALLATSTFVIIAIIERYRAGKRGGFSLTRKQKVHMPPGHRWARVLGWLLPKGLFDVHFAQVIADMQDEAAALDDEGKTLQRRWIVTIYHLALVWSVISFVIVVIIKRAKSLWTAL